MIDGKPTYTIQLDVSMGVMNVVQIAGVANQRLSEEEREQYSTAFKRALQSRKSELNSKSWSHSRGVLFSLKDASLTMEHTDDQLLAMALANLGEYIDDHSPQYILIEDDPRNEEDYDTWDVGMEPIPGDQTWKSNAIDVKSSEVNDWV